MVNFVEKATLVLDDKTGSKVDSINRKLAKMRRNADALAKSMAKISMPTRLGNADKKIADMADSMSKFARAAKKVPKQVEINIKLTGMSVSSLRNMTRALEAYKKVAGSKTTNLNVRGGGGPGSRTPSNASNGSILLNVKPFEIMWRTAMYQLSSTIFNAIRDGFATGVKGFDIASNKFQQQRIDDATRSLFVEQSFEQNRRNGGLRPDQRQDFYAEVQSNFRNPREVLRLDDSVNRAIAVQIQQGQTIDEAFQGVATFFRGLGQAGLLTNQEGGLNTEVIKFIDAYTSAKLAEGAQVDWNAAFQALKYSKTSGQTLTPEAFFFLMSQAADVGASTAGTQLNMATKTFAGETTKKAIAAQEAGGLRGPGKFVPMGKTQKGEISYTLEGGDLVDEEMFRENTFRWIEKHIIGPGGFLEKQGIDPKTASPSKVISALDPLSGNRNSDDFLAKAVLQYQEALLKREKFFDRPITNEEVKAINDTSSWVKLQDATNRLTTLFGVLGTKLEGPIIGALNIVDKFAQSAIDTLLGTSADKVVDGAIFAGGAGGLTAGAVGLAKFFLATPLNTAATNANTAALLANTAALGGGAAGGALNGGKAAAGAGFFARFMKLGLVGSAAYLSMSPPLPESDQERIQKQLAMLEARDKSPEIQETSRKLSEAINKLAVLQTEIDYAKSQGYSSKSDYMLGKTADAAAVQSNIDSLQLSLATSALEIQQAFDGGATKITDATGQFDESITSLLNTAGTWGSNAAAAFMGAVGSLNLNVNSSGGAAAAPNVGTNTNLATGG